MFKYWSSIAPPPLSFLSLRPSIIDAGANSRAGMEVPDDPEVGPDKEQSTLQPLIESQVRDLTRTLAKRSYPLDPLPTSLVVSCLDILLPVSRAMINSSLTTGHG